MAIPKEILAISRPKNTRVKATGKGTYSVIARTCVYKNGRNVPKELGTIGHIINGVYVPNPKPKEEEVDVKSYGEFALYDLVGNQLLIDLCSIYDYKDAIKLYCIALLRAIDPGIRNRDLETEYLCSYISEKYPDVGLSKNTVSSFLDEIGKHTLKITEFMQKRLDKLSEENVVIDGMLKSNTAESNTFSEFSRKARIKGTEDISLIYAYDTTAKEPVACMPYAGNMLDSTSFDDFLNTFDIHKGFMLMDKGFSSAKLRQVIVKKGISYVVPLKNNCKEITEYSLDKGFDGFLETKDSNIRYKKVVGKKGHFYYAFHDKKIANDQGDIYINRGRKDGTFDEKKYEEKESRFGLIVFESNKDLDPVNIYEAYAERWEIETVFKMYKSILDRDEVNVQGDYRLYATEFINFLSTILVCRVKKMLAAKGLNKSYSYKQIMKFMTKYKKLRLPSVSEVKWRSCKCLAYIQEVIDALGI